MNTEIENLELGVFVLLLGIFFLLIRNKINIPPEKAKYYCKPKQIRNKRIIGGIFLILSGVVLIINYLSKLSN